MYKQPAIRSRKSSTVSNKQPSKEMESLIKEIRNSDAIQEVRVIQPRLLFVNGLTTDIANQNILRRQPYFGQYGKVVKVTVTKAKDDLWNAFIEFSEDKQAATALLSVEGFIHGGKVIRVFYGSTKYCYSYLKGEDCVIPFCSFSHSFQKGYTYFKQNTASINHSKIAQKILKRQAPSVREISQNTVFPTAERAIGRLQDLSFGTDSSSSGSLTEMAAEDWQDLQKEIDQYTSTNQNKEPPRKRTAIQEFLDQAEERLLSLIFKASVQDERHV